MSTEATGATVVERLGRYEILGSIASGGMATVFLGRVTGAKGFQRLVAIKRLHPHLETEEDFITMFLDEARLAAKIRHQNVVGTLDVEDQEGLYIVMEYIEGDRLLGLLRHANRTGERIPIPVAIRIALDTLAGLHAAHELPDDDGEPLGLVHRDVSPQNILIGVDGVARLTDFGIAKATSRLTVTRDGQLKGKIAYMAPEQTKRVEIDRRVDVFAMGIITWEMFASKKLFTGESDVEVLNQLLFEPVPKLRDMSPGIPIAIELAVMKALERDPAKRFSTASEFADALERASKIVGGPANARTVASHLQKVSADKLAKDRARVLPGMPSDSPASSRVRRVSGTTGDQHETIASSETPATGPSIPPARRNSSSNLPAARMSLPPPLPMGPPPRMSQSNLPIAHGPSYPPNSQPGPIIGSGLPMRAGPSLVDDDEDVPTATGQRPDRTSDSPPPNMMLPNSGRPASASRLPTAGVAFQTAPPASSPRIAVEREVYEEAASKPASSGRLVFVGVCIALFVVGGGAFGWRVLHPETPANTPAEAHLNPHALTAPPSHVAPVAPSTTAPIAPVAVAVPQEPVVANPAPVAVAPTPVAAQNNTVGTDNNTEAAPVHRGGSHPNHARANPAPAPAQTAAPAPAPAVHHNAPASNDNAPAPTPAPSRPHDEDPFGSDNPYQR